MLELKKKLALNKERLQKQKQERGKRLRKEGKNSRQRRIWRSGCVRTGHLRIGESHEAKSLFKPKEREGVRECQNRLIKLIGEGDYEHGYTTVLPDRDCDAF